MEARSGNQTPFNKIIEPLVKQTVYLAVHEGLIGEPHSQNVLIETDARFQPTGKFWYRDFGGFSLDPDLRKAAGKSGPALLDGINARDLKNKSGHKLTTYIDVYLKHGNLYSLRQALRETHPEITEAWMNETFNKTLIHGFSQSLGQPFKIINEVEPALNRIRNAGGGIMNCILNFIKRI